MQNRIHRLNYTGISKTGQDIFGNDRSEFLIARVHSIDGTRPLNLEKICSSARNNLEKLAPPNGVVQTQSKDFF